MSCDMAPCLAFSVVFLVTLLPCHIAISLLSLYARTHAAWARRWFVVADTGDTQQVLLVVGHTRHKCFLSTLPRALSCLLLCSCQSIHLFLLFIYLFSCFFPAPPAMTLVCCLTVVVYGFDGGMQEECCRACDVEWSAGKALSVPFSFSLLIVSILVCVLSMSVTSP